MGRHIEICNKYIKSIGTMTLKPSYKDRKRQKLGTKRERSHTDVQ